MNNLKSLIIEFDNVLKEKNLVNYNRLQQPLPSEKFNTSLLQLELDDEDFKTLYSWKNGTNILKSDVNQCEILKFGTIMAIENILEYQTPCTGDQRWKYNFIPIVSNYDGEYILFNKKKGADYGKLFLYSVALSFTNPISYYDSIGTMIETNVTAYNEGAIIYIENEDWLDINNKKFGLIASQINEKSKYWKLK